MQDNRAHVAAKNDFRRCSVNKKLVIILDGEHLNENYPYKKGLKYKCQKCVHHNVLSFHWNQLFKFFGVLNFEQFSDIWRQQSFISARKHLKKLIARGPTAGPVIEFLLLVIFKIDDRWILVIDSVVPSLDYWSDCNRLLALFVLDIWRNKWLWRFWLDLAHLTGFRIEVLLDYFILNLTDVSETENSTSHF